jgi:branched-chain amino acid transport system substrate-binding protein
VRWLLLVVVAATVAACARPAVRPDPGPVTVPASDDLYAGGLAALRAGKAAEAARSFRAYLKAAEEEDGQTEAARAYLIRALVSDGECDEARAELPALEGVLAADAASAVAGCRPRFRLPTDEAGQRRELARALSEGDAVAAVLLGNALGAALDEADRAQVIAVVDAMDAPLLAHVQPLLRPGWPGAELAFRRVALRLHAGDLEAAAKLLTEVTDPALRARAQASLDAARLRAQVAPQVVLVLLPLTGRHAAVGKELRVAIELAAAGDRDVKLVFADTTGDEVRAATLVDEQVAAVHPLVILGPVGERESAAAAARAVALGVPIALLTPTEGVAFGPSGVVRLWSSAEGRARAAARAAVSLGYQAPAVLVPRDEVGRAQARAFTEAVTRAGGQVVASGEYDPTATQLEPDLKVFLGLDPRTNERLRLHLRRDPKNGWKTFSPDVEFDLLFVPDSFDRATLIAAFLEFFNVELRTSDMKDSLSLRKKHGGRIPTIVQLLGSSGWHSPELIVRGGGTIEGALLVDDFAGIGTEDFTSDEAAAFAQRWQTRTGRSPTTLAAQAFDAATMVLAARRRALSGGGPPRKAMARALSGASLPAGVCGPARVNLAGELERGVVLLRVDGGQFVIEDTVE